MKIVYVTYIGCVISTHIRDIYKTYICAIKKKNLLIAFMGFLVCISYLFLLSKSFVSDF